MAKVTIDFRTPANSRDYVFMDLLMPFKLSDIDQLEVSKDIHAIRGSLKNIFGWNKGERILLPEFGNILNDFLYSIINDTTTANIRAAIIKMFNWEPRVNITTINIVPLIDDMQYNINVVYEIPDLQVQDQFDFVVTITN